MSYIFESYRARWLYYLWIKFMYIKVKVQAGSKKEKIEKKSENSYVISVREPAERNLANKRICAIISSIYKVNVKSVRIVSGHLSPSKILSVIIPSTLV